VLLHIRLTKGDVELSAILLGEIHFGELGDDHVPAILLDGQVVRKVSMSVALGQEDDFVISVLYVLASERTVMDVVHVLASHEVLVSLIFDSV